LCPPFTDLTDGDSLNVSAEIEEPDILDSPVSKKRPRLDSLFAPEKVVDVSNTDSLIVPNSPPRPRNGNSISFKNYFSMNLQKLLKKSSSIQIAPTEESEQPGVENLEDIT